MSNDPKLIGLMTGWGCRDWIHPALDQALEYCDEVLVCISPHSESMVSFEDDSYRIAKKREGIKVVENNEMSHHSVIKAKILNKMLMESENFEVGNWIWILDIDEFYTANSYNNIRKIIKDIGCDQIDIISKFFLINMRHHLISEHDRLFRINDKSNRFIPTQKWSGTRKVFKFKPEAINMFHYSMLTNSHIRMQFWKTEYPGMEQNEKVRWLDEIYRHYDLKDEDTWLEKNRKLCGVRTPWIKEGFEPNEDGKLFYYRGKHPKFIERLPLINVEDFRKYYRF